MISENTVLYDLLKMVYIHLAKKEAQQTELKWFKTFALLFWDSLLRPYVTPGLKGKQYTMVGTVALDKFLDKWNGWFEKNGSKVWRKTNTLKLFTGLQLLLVFKAHDVYLLKL